MSGLTPEAARAAAEWLDNNVGYDGSARELRAKADRLEAAARTPGRVAFGEFLRQHDFKHPDTNQDAWEAISAAVIAHHVGPDRVVVDRGDVSGAATNLDRCGCHTSASLLREALS